VFTPELKVTEIFASAVVKSAFKAVTKEDSEYMPGVMLIDPVILVVVIYNLMCQNPMEYYTEH